jgi:hypothetical protein
LLEQFGGGREARLQLRRHASVQVVDLVGVGLVARDALSRLVKRRPGTLLAWCSRLPVERRLIVKSLAVERATRTSIVIEPDPRITYVLWVLI